MDNIKSRVAKNITQLRTRNNLTQLELGAKLNYSDKTISKWERGDSTPDIAVLVQMAELFGVTLDQLVRAEDIEDIEETKPEQKNNKKEYNRRVILHIAESAAWCVAIFAFVITSLILNRTSFQWLYFVYALPIVAIVRLVLNSIWFNRRHNYVIVSILMWSILAAIHLTFFYFSKDASLIYILGAAGQIVIVLWSFISRPKAK